MEQLVGFQRSPIADIGEPVHAAGVPIILYGFNVIAAVTGTGPEVQFYNDSEGFTGLTIKVNTPADVPTTIIYPAGIVFPNGCFLDVSQGADVVQVTVFYKVL